MRIRHLSSLFLACVLLCAAAFAGEDGSPDPFGKKKRTSDAARPATVIHSADGTLADARVRVRPGKSVTVFVAEEKKHVEIPFAEIRVLRQTVRAEGLEKEWRWKEGGGNEKLYTGKAYPWRTYAVEIETTDGKTVKGQLASGVPVRVTWTAGEIDPHLKALAAGDGGAVWKQTQSAGHSGAEFSRRDLAALRAKVKKMIDAATKTETFLLQPKAKGTLGQSLDDLPYLKEVRFEMPTDEKIR